MESNPLLTVIIPAYNSSLYLREAIGSILAQSYQPKEILIIDDGSTDNTSEIAHSYKEIKYIHQENKGPASARNHGISIAHGEYLAFHDADDICLPNRLSAQMDVLLNNKQVEILFSRIQNFVDPSATVPKYLQTEQLMKPRMGFVSSAIIKKSTFDKVGWFNEDLKIGEDLDWIIRAEELKVCSSSMTDILIKRRLHGSNISRDLSTGHKNLAQILLAKIKRN